MSEKIHQPMLLRLANNGDISWLSYYFAEFISAQSDCGMSDLLAYSAALVSEANQAGDICLELSHCFEQPLFNSQSIPNAEMVIGINAEQWANQLLQSPCVKTPGGKAPLILEDGRLYLSRYWFYEDKVAKDINHRLKLSRDINLETSALFIDKELERLFGDSDDNRQADQKSAVAASVKNRFSVISGGPGTGKTTTVVNILALLLSHDPKMRIALAAPTGKAAARMMESIQNRIDIMPLDETVKSSIPTEASTIHRLLGYKFHHFYYHQKHKLAIDCLVIDEASMLDLPLIFHLLDALPNQARVILLGDKDQLASVAAGSVLADITADSQDENSQSLIAQSTSLLKQSFRFAQDSGIGKLARLINAGDHQSVMQLLKADDDSIMFISPDGDQLDRASIQPILTAYQGVLHADQVSVALDRFANCRILCALNKGHFGVSQINRLVEQALNVTLADCETTNYQGKPILINRNDYDLELFNGDIGILWPDQNGDLQAWFQIAPGQLRNISIHRLPEHTTAWAMTVHKAQGSEFDQLILVLPPIEKSISLSKELLYTGITRAKKSVSIVATEASISQAVKSVTVRHSGLAKKLSQL